ncbi:adhesion G protein-coupled receptor A3-like [Ptychodera flava]|uniref:adhesion G protein-coupled receptor A3-like n=1 Tax=Ptychodera flava TaxID=63121 RepID=UPI00396A0922
MFSGCIWTGEKMKRPVNPIPLMLFAICLQALIDAGTPCPIRCTCNVIRSRPDSDPDRTPRGRRVLCTKSGLDNPFEKTLVPSDTVQLDLSGNVISILRSGVFSGLSSLERLNLGNNRISIIEPGAFEGLSSLQRLDLSGNRLGKINSSMFIGLQNLEKLNLSNNQIASITEGTFDQMISLQSVDFQSDYLMCDCLLKWIVKWSKNNKKISDSTTCMYPRTLRGEKLKDLKKRHFNCDDPLELPFFEITPPNNQVVFLGDKLPLTCTASYLDDTTKIMWYKMKKEVSNNQTAGITILTQPTHDQSRLRSKLTIERLEKSNGGVWECRAITSRGNESRSVNIVVLENDATFCQSESTTDNKGTIRWSMTVAGVKTFERCPQGSRMSSSGGSRLTHSASRQCKSGGVWDVPDTTACQFASSNTQWFERLAMSEINATNALKKARDLEMQTSDAHTFKDKMDAIFIARVMEQFSKFTDAQLGTTMINIASNVMEMDETLLASAQETERACSRIVTSLEKFAGDVLLSKVKILTHIAPNIVLEAFRTPTTFDGDFITCASFVGDEGVNSAYNEKRFACYTANITSTQLDTDEKTVEASIQLPVSLFSKLREKHGIDRGTTFRLQVLVYKNGKLFPNTGNTTKYAAHNGRRKVSSSVISSKIAGFTLENLTEPVILTFRPFQQGSDPIAAFWNFEALSRKGAWDSTGCKIVQHNENKTSVHCSHLTNFAILKETHGSDGQMERMDRWRSGLMQPIVYVGSGVCLIAILSTIMTYACFYSQIRLSRKSVHSLMNVSTSIMLTVTTFGISGLNKTESVAACYVIEVAIHYFTQCTLVWLAIAAGNLNGRLSKKDQVLPPGEPPPPPRPMMRFYFLGWGVPAIVVSISAAADSNKYNGLDYCWLEVQSNIVKSLQMIAFLVFVSIMFVVNIVFFVSTSRKLQTMPRKYEVKQIEQNRENENAERDLPLTDLESLGTHTVATSVATSFLDAEHSYQSQLRSLVFMLFVFLAMWVCGAMAITQEYYLNLMFSYLYGAASAALGIFIFFYNCVMRNDVRLGWRRCCGCQRRTRYAFSVDSGSGLQSNGQVYHHKQSASSIDSSYTNRSNTTNRSYHSNPSYRPVPTGRKNYLDTPGPTTTYTDHSISTVDSRTRPYVLQQRPNGTAAQRHMQKSKNRPPNHVKYSSRSHHHHHPYMHSQPYAHSSHTFPHASSSHARPYPLQHYMHSREMMMNSLGRMDNRPQSRGSVADSHSSFPESQASTVRGGPSHYSSEAHAQGNASGLRGKPKEKEREKKTAEAFKDSHSKSQNSLPRDTSRDSSLSRAGKISREPSSHSIKQKASTPDDSSVAKSLTPVSNENADQNDFESKQKETEKSDSAGKDNVSSDESEDGSLIDSPDGSQACSTSSDKKKNSNWKKETSV